MELIKYCHYWQKVYGVKYLMSNLVKIIVSFYTLKEIAQKYNIEDEWTEFFKKKVTFNKHFTEQYIGQMVYDWDIRRGKNYMHYLQEIFKGGKK